MAWMRNLQEILQRMREELMRKMESTKGEGGVLLMPIFQLPCVILLKLDIAAQVLVHNCMLCVLYHGVYLKSGNMCY